MARTRGVPTDVMPDRQGYAANEDMTDYQWCPACENGSDDTVLDLCDGGAGSHGEYVEGIVVNRPDDGDKVQLRTEGITPAILDGGGTSISKGDPLRTNAAHHFEKADASSDIADYEALEGSDGDGQRRLVRRIKHTVIA